MGTWNAASGSVRAQGVAPRIVATTEQRVEDRHAVLERTPGLRVFRIGAVLEPFDGNAAPRENGLV